MDISGLSVLSCIVLNHILTYHVIIIHTLMISLSESVELSLL